MKNEFKENRKIVYTAFSKHYYYAHIIISSYVANHKMVPLNPFCNFGYFLYDNSNRDDIRICNNNMIRIADEMWVFGPIANGVFAEIIYALELNKPIKYFSAGTTAGKIKIISHKDLEIEEELVKEKGKQTVIKVLNKS